MSISFPWIAFLKSNFFALYISNSVGDFHVFSDTHDIPAWAFKHQSPIWHPTLITGKRLYNTRHNRSPGRLFLDNTHITYLIVFVCVYASIKTGFEFSLMLCTGYKHAEYGIFASKWGKGNYLVSCCSVCKKGGQLSVRILRFILSSSTPMSSRLLFSFGWHAHT